METTNRPSRPPMVSPEMTSLGSSIHGKLDIKDSSKLPQPTGRGGGSQRSIGGAFRVNAENGTSSLTIPIRTSPSRGGTTPSLSLTYDSGSGNGPFGLGWTLPVGAISRKTSEGVPKYEERDIFQLGGSEDLVPTLRLANDLVGTENGNLMVFHERQDGEYLVRKYRPRVDKTVSRIERWTKACETGDVHWRTISGDGITTLYGRDENSQIFDFQGRFKRIFSWLVCEIYDLCGNHTTFSYKTENSEGINLQISSEANRGRMARARQRYLTSIKYGNRAPNRALTTWDVYPGGSEERKQEQFMFEVIFDYGERECEENPTTTETKPWTARQDAFSSHKSGFEVRTYRLCRRILLFHHMPEKLDQVEDCLVSAMELEYEESGSVALLASAKEIGYRPKSAGGYISQALPPVKLSYTTLPDMEHLAVEEIDASSILQIPGLNGAKAEWMDLDSEGAPGILTTVPGGGWYYQQTMCGGHQPDTKTCFSPPHLLPVTPRGVPEDAVLTFEDVGRKGKLSFVVMDPDGGLCGYYERTTEDGWSNFVPFATFPVPHLGNTGSRRLDLTGNGSSDLLEMVDENGDVVWSPCLGSEGFGPQRRSANTERPVLAQGDEQEGYFFADMSGDGLSDIVRIRNGNVMYWPNQGHGKFGTCVTMDNSPFIDAKAEFSVDRLRLLDVDGSGTTDLLYLPSGGSAHVYINLAGNGWSERRIIKQFPTLDQASSVSAVDLLGSGTGCLCWTSFTIPGNITIQYMDLTGGIKPHLLSKYSNEMGLETTIVYAPSTKYYNEDKLRGLPWQTTCKLPFPVHCVDKVITRDKVSQTSQITRYAYHDGYYDWFDHEFRGFGMVEQWDAENFADGIGVKYQQPPAHKKSWFHTGAEKHTSTLYNTFGVPELAPSQIPEQLSTAEWLEAHRALKGFLLREELFSDDKSQAAALPYTVMELNYNVQMRQRGQDDTNAVFVVHPRESISLQYERALEDPRIEQNFILAVDEFGGTTKSASIKYGRNKGSLANSCDREKEEKALLTYIETEYTNPIDDGPEFRHPLVAGSRTYRILGKNLSRRLAFEALAEHDFAFEKMEELQSVANPVVDPTRGRKVLLVEEKLLYRASDLSKILDHGKLETYSVLDQTHQLSFTTSLLKELLRRDDEPLVSDVELDSILTSAGYVELEKESGKWWTQSNRFLYSENSSTELMEARQNFYMPTITVDPFQGRTRDSFDDLKLLIVSKTDAIGNLTQLKNDYVALLPYQVTNCNGNRTEVLNDPLGNMIAHAALGKETEELGDSLDGLDAILTFDQLDDFIQDPLAHAEAVLGNAGSRSVFDPTRFHRKGLPCYEAVIARETHCHPADEPLTPSKTLVIITYLNGSTSPMQSVELSDFVDDVPRWRFSSWTITDNKGQPVKQLHPFFAPDHFFRFQSDDAGRIAHTTLLRDPLGRLEGTLNPDHSWNKTHFCAWSETTIDEGGTVLISDPSQDPFIGSSFRGLDAAEYMPSWYDAQLKGDKWDQDAATKSLDYKGFTKTSYFDAAHRPFLTIESSGSQDIVSRNEYDLHGRLSGSRDALDRLVVRHSYDLLSRSLKQEWMDKAATFMFFDVLGRRILSWDGRDIRSRLTYDALGRHLETYVRKGTAPEIVISKNFYGESIKDPETRNLRGQIVKSFDQAGTRTNELFDFKGNCISTQVQLAVDYKTMLDWSDPSGVRLEAATFTEIRKFDAYNRAYWTMSPNESTTLREYNWGGQEKSVKSIPSPRYPEPWKTFVGDTTYTAHGQRSIIKYGNGTRTQHEYDSITLRLMKTKTIRTDGAIVQDLAYKYDIRGKITSIQNNAQQDVYFRNAKISPVQSFTHGCFGQLIEARGREQFDANNGGGYYLTPFTSATRRQNTLPGNGDQLCEYLERYKYDLAGNILELAHSSISHPEVSGWTRKYEYNEPSLIESGTVNNRLSRTTVGSVAENYGYDDDAGRNGCMTSMPGFASLQWDINDRLQSCSTHRQSGGTPEKTYFVYDGTGTRVRKTTERSAADGQQPTKLKETISLGAFESYQTFSGDGITPSYSRQTAHIIGDDRIALMESDSNGKALERYAMNENLELDEKGQVISYEEYSPFGATTYRACRADVEAPSKYRYRRYERDTETGLSLCGDRYYPAWLGRWTSLDPSVLLDGLNMYAYCGNEPVMFQDHSGNGRDMSLLLLAGSILVAVAVIWVIKLLASTHTTVTGRRARKSIDSTSGMTSEARLPEPKTRQQLQVERVARAANEKKRLEKAEARNRAEELARQKEWASMNEEKSSNSATGKIDQKQRHLDAEIQRAEGVARNSQQKAAEAAEAQQVAKEVAAERRRIEEEAAHAAVADPVLVDTVENLNTFRRLFLGIAVTWDEFSKAMTAQEGAGFTRVPVRGSEYRFSKAGMVPANIVIHAPHGRRDFNQHEARKHLSDIWRWTAGTFTLKPK